MFKYLPTLPPPIQGDTHHLRKNERPIAAGGAARRTIIGGAYVTPPETAANKTNDKITLFCHFSVTSEFLAISN